MTVPPAAPTPPTSRPSPTLDPPVRRMRRDTEGSVLGGVAAGLSEHLGLPVLWLRVAFIVLSAASGFGAIFYVALWALVPSRERFETSTPGAESALRGGRRPGPIRRLADAGPMVALAALGVGVIFVLQLMLGFGQSIWPVLLAGGGLALIWRQADEAQRERWLDGAGRIDPVQILFGQGWQSWVRIAAGSVLLVAAATYIAVLNSSVTGLLVTSVLVLAGIGVLVAPLLARLARDLSAEREERIRTQERADVAAHLHDSVLQTLALIQKNATDPGVVARLARAQERDLRSWLYAGDADAPPTLGSALRAVAAEAEDAHGLTVEVVSVGEVDFCEAVRPVVAATKEALTNVAKHAGVTQVSVYVEAQPGEVEVFIRDRGVGFDPATVGADRHGVADSIIDRMRRHGGAATVVSAPGEGTEVRLRMPLEMSETSAAVGESDE